MSQDKESPDLAALTPRAGVVSFGRAARRLASGVLWLTGWLGDRVEDLGKWATAFVRYLPIRLYRVVARCAAGITAVFTLLPTGSRVLRYGGREHLRPWLQARAGSGLMRLVQLAFDILDVFGIPELVAFFWRIVTHCSPLTGEEVAAAESVLGRGAIRFQDVRVAEGGILNPIFRRNGNRAYAMFHTINLPGSGPHTREHLHIVVHELVHVYQYERAGSRYIAEALLAQHREGYGYGDETGLAEAKRLGKRLRNFNREQQARIAEDYFRSGVRSSGESAYDPYIAELRSGKI